MQFLDTLLLLFQDPIRNGWSIALLFLAIGSIPNQLYTWITTKKQETAVQYNIAGSDATPSDIPKYSLWLRCFICWWDKPPRGLLEYVWKSLFIPFLITYSVGELICVVFTIVSVIFFLASFV
jgi:hypothetical protein